MKADLQSLLAPKAKNMIEEFEAKGYDMKGDADLFLCYNENWKKEAQFPHEVTGQIARIKLSQGYYHVEYSRPNPTPKQKEIEQLSAETAAAARAAVEEARQATLAAQAAKAPKEVKVEKAPDGLKEVKRPAKKGTVIE